MQKPPAARRLQAEGTFQCLSARWGPRRASTAGWVASGWDSCQQGGEPFSSPPCMIFCALLDFLFLSIPFRISPRLSPHQPRACSLDGGRARSVPWICRGVYWNACRSPRHGESKLLLMRTDSKVNGLSFFHGRPPGCAGWGGMHFARGLVVPVLCALAGYSFCPMFLCRG